MDFSRVKKSKADIGLIPLINVIFLLLIFFMVAGTVEGIDIFEVSLPESVSGKEKTNSNAVIYLGSHGKMAVNNDIVAKKDMETIISTLFIENPRKIVTIKADSDIAASKLLWIMSLVEKHGGDNIALVTKVVN